MGCGSTPDTQTNQTQYELAEDSVNFRGQEQFCIPDPLKLETQDILRPSEMPLMSKYFQEVRPSCQVIANF